MTVFAYTTIGMTPDTFIPTGNEGDRYLRFAFCRSMETIEAGIERLRKLAGRP